MSSEEYLFTLVDDIQTREATIGYDALSPAERVFFCIWTVEAEVNNGGFAQFYANSSGDIAHDAPDAFRTIGAEYTASLVEKANAVFGRDGPPIDSGIRQEIVDEFDDASVGQLGELDSAFLQYRDNLSELLATYMKTNR